MLVEFFHEALKYSLNLISMMKQVLLFSSEMQETSSFYIRGLLCENEFESAGAVFGVLDRKSKWFLSMTKKLKKLPFGLRRVLSASRKMKKAGNKPKALNGNLIDLFNSCNSSRTQKEVRSINEKEQGVL